MVHQYDTESILKSVNHFKCMVDEQGMAWFPLLDAMLTQHFPRKEVKIRLPPLKGFICFVIVLTRPGITQGVT